MANSALTFSFFSFFSFFSTSLWSAMKSTCDWDVAGAAGVAAGVGAGAGAGAWGAWDMVFWCARKKNKHYENLGKWA